MDKNTLTAETKYYYFSSTSNSLKGGRKNSAGSAPLSFEMYGEEGKSDMVRYLFMLNRELSADA